MLRRVVSWLLTLLVVGGLVYTGYVGYEGSRQLVETSTEPGECRTPDVQFGWAYEAINYDISEDAALRTVNPDMAGCIHQGTPAGDAVVTDDGVRIAGWYIPAADGSGPTASTVVLVHGFNNTKANILEYGEGLHQQFNLVAFDMRNRGRSTGTQTTAGVLEQKDLRAIIDWVEREKHPAHLGVLGNSLGAATAMAEARDDPRVEALALDSMHTRLRYQIEARLQHAGHPAYPGTWAIFLGIRIRTGVDVGSIDAADEIGEFTDRPILLSHGTADTEDLPARTQDFYDDALAAGATIELHWCEEAGHNAPAGMPVVVCHDEFGTWMRDFFSRNLAGT